MGIVNVTPNSFSDGGRHVDPAAAVARAKALAAEGAAIVDIGGESTRPGHAPVAPKEESGAFAPVLEALARELDAPLSIDTTKAAVAREAARLGASVINDVWGLQRDPGMADAVAETGSAVVVMHNREAIDAAVDILDDVERFFERSLGLAARAGVPFGRILLDPGVGFGKTPEQNHACIWNLDRFRRLGPPLLVGVVAQVVHRPDRRRRSGRAPRRHACRRHGRAHARRLRAARARRRRAPAGARRVPGARRRRPAASAARAADGRAEVVLALGGNVGDKAGALRRALAALDDQPDIALAAVSRFYRTPPWGKTDQDWFVNACALARTDLTPEALLDRVKAIETALGRTPSERWGPRLIDIDIIAYDDLALRTDRLTLPHPELFNRAFVLAPLAEIAPGRIIGGRRVGEAAAEPRRRGRRRGSTGLSAPKRRWFAFTPRRRDKTMGG